MSQMAYVGVYRLLRTATGSAGGVVGMSVTCGFLQSIGGPLMRLLKLSVWLLALHLPRLRGMAVIENSNIFHFRAKGRALSATSKIFD